LDRALGGALLGKIELARKFMPRHFFLCLKVLLRGKKDQREDWLTAFNAMTLSSIPAMERLLPHTVSGQ